jgi:hypothetical protein
MIPGQPFYIGAEIYLIPPLSIAQYQKSKVDRDALRKAFTDNGDLTSELLDAGMRVVLPAAQRNYPDMTIDDLANGISPSALFAITAYVLTPSATQTQARLDGAEEAANRAAPKPVLIIPSEVEVV